MHLTREDYQTLSKQNYAFQFPSISPQDRHIIIHAKKSLLYHQNIPWAKTSATDMFDVTMGSYDGAEICELIGAYMLSLIAAKFKDRVGLYRDDGLAVCRATPKEIKKQNKKLAKFSSLMAGRSPSKLIRKQSIF